jgi:hypothetical protein
MAIALGLVAFAMGIISTIWSIYNYALLERTLGSITAAIFALTGFECFHHGLSPQDKEYRFFSRGLRGLFIDVVNLVLAVFLMLATVNYQRPSDPLCGGRLSAGFPLAFLCDKTGESPINDWGKISWIDIPNPLGLFMNILLYAALLWIISSIAKKIIHQTNKRTQIRQ